MTDKMEEQIKEISKLMQQLIDSQGVPKNVKALVSEAKQKLNDEKEGEYNVRITSAIYLIEEAGEDINLPMHTRTQIWAILSSLERATHE
ncbi:UPF0147 family protein [Candidatus Micrarchaeota archaeon]|nr:UPF0147 family protein [Candidatus Micrarchaeota archaeon]